MVSAVTGGTHIAVANLSYLALGALGLRFGWPLPVDWTHLGLVSLYGVLADLDSPAGWLGRQVPLVATLVERRCGRRGWTHSIWALLISVCPWLTIGGSLAMAALVGYACHLLCDALTRPGIQPFGPLVPLRLKGGLRNGGFWDVLVGMHAVVGSWICLVQRVGSPAAQALAEPFAWGAVLALVGLVPGWLLSTAVRRL